MSASTGKDNRAGYIVLALVAVLLGAAAVMNIGDADNSDELDDELLTDPVDTADDEPTGTLPTTTVASDPRCASAITQGVSAFQQADTLSEFDSALAPSILACRYFQDWALGLELAGLELQGTQASELARNTCQQTDIAATAPICAQVGVRP